MFIIEANYKNGDQYADKAENITEVIELLKEIDAQDTFGEDRILSDTVTIENVGDLQ